MPSHRIPSHPIASHPTPSHCIRNRISSHGIFDRQTLPSLSRSRSPTPTPILVLVLVLALACPRLLFASPQSTIDSAVSPISSGCRPCLPRATSENHILSARTIPASELSRTTHSHHPLTSRLCSLSTRPAIPSFSHHTPSQTTALHPSPLLPHVAGPELAPIVSPSVTPSRAKPPTVLTNSVDRPI